MSIKLHFIFKALIIVCINIVICSTAFGQNEKSSRDKSSNDKSSTTSSKNLVAYRKNVGVTPKPKSKTKTIAKTKNLFVPVKTYFPFFDDSMIDFGPELSDTPPLYDESTEEFGPEMVDHPEYFDDSMIDFGPARSASRHHDYSMENFRPKEPGFFTKVGRWFGFKGGLNKEYAEPTDMAYSGKGTAVKAGVIRKTPILVSRFPSKEEQRIAAEKLKNNDSTLKNKLLSQVLRKQKESTETKEIISPR
jgi:hypothetical protein